ncbi:phosphosulfolactate synthase [Fodinisporobacter ferrooxydans]|uniref:Phosphosulfolactate synthase n=1 Tax=Fodinisporobacter ferrooxydans TaxID=2901836 RepID=A0ABY4CGW6_9BACL|nr:phosphosulfolactate synthase [Alicyclobacillaceae bacterium MYW30-H2]
MCQWLNRIDPQALTDEWKGASSPMTGPFAWQNIVLPPLADRTKSKPRKDGVTMVIDTGLGLQETRDLLNLAGNFIDIIKLGFGSAYLYPETILREKIALLKEHQIEICPGGTFLEIAVLQDVWKQWMERCAEIGFTCVEVSDGTIDLPRPLRNQLIRYAQKLDFQVFGEIGKKEDGSHLPVAEQLQQIEEDLAHGAKLVIIEGRESGKNVGMYEKDGSLRFADVEQLMKSGIDKTLVIWEAPLKSQQVQFIKYFGANVNIGNIAPTAVLSLECLRQGLRSDTIPKKVVKPQQMEEHPANLSISSLIL